MSNLIKSIQEIIRPAFIQSGTIHLREDDPGSTCNVITLHKSGQAFAVRPDQSGGKICPRPECAYGLSATDRLFPLFRIDITALSAMCDYIVFYQQPSSVALSRFFVFLCELKSNNVNGSLRQAENGRILADYILEMAIHHCDLPARPKIERRALIFSPKFKVPKGNLTKNLCSYSRPSRRFQDLPFAYYACGAEYPLEHFCV